MPKQILIVDDEYDCAELLSYHLRKERYQTVIARNGAEAVQEIQRRMPDAILLDVMMPELNGWEVCRIVRESPKGKSLPIIMLSALSAEEERVKGLILGADDYVSKPYSMKELLLKIKKHLDLRQSITQLKVREQEQDTTLKYMIHELRNSLTAIGGFSTVALRKDDTNKYLKTISNAASHAESLLNDASLLSRLEKEGEGLSMDSVDIYLLVDEAIDILHDTAKRSNREIRVANSTSAMVKGDRTAIRQVLINLISNALKYNRESGKVWIHFEESDGRLDISVIDEGNGIIEADLSRIFEKFYRAPGSEQQKGAGLGLYIVKCLTETMGGSVTVTSQPGMGSTFTVSFLKSENAAVHYAQGAT